MNNELELKIKAILSLLMKFNILFPKHLREPDEVLSVWAKYLAGRNFTVKQIHFALSELTKKGLVFVPGAHEIAGVLLPAIEPKEFRAEKIATEIQDAIIDTNASRKVNFIDELPADTIQTIENLGGYRQLREIDFSKDWNRNRLVKSAMATLNLIEANKRNEKLIAQGIPCVAISEFKINQIEDVDIEFKKTNKEEGLKPFSGTLAELSKSFKEIHESIPETTNAIK